jgi:hypothetical protein
VVILHRVAKLFETGKGEQERIENTSEIFTRRRRESDKIERWWEDVVGTARSARAK